MSVVTDSNCFVVDVNYASEEEYNRVQAILAQVRSELEAEKLS